MVAAPTRESVLEILEEVKDPEVPVLSVVELGIIRDVEVRGDDVTVVVTPTYSGCPAMKIIEDDVLAALASHGITSARMRTIFTPAWTTDWMSDAARRNCAPTGLRRRGHDGRARDVAASSGGGVPVLWCVEHGAYERVRFNGLQGAARM